MTWTKIDESFSDHPKILEAGPLAELLQIRALQYCNRLLTDGLISKTAVDRLARDLDGYRENGRRVTAQSLAKKLVASGIWEQRGDDYAIHDFHEFQPTRARVLADRDAAKERMQRLRGSGNVRPNKDGTSPEVRETFGDSVAVAVPSPVAKSSIAPRPDERKCWAWLHDHGLRDDAEAAETIAETRSMAMLRTDGKLRALDSYALTNPTPDKIHLLEQVFLRRLNARREARDHERDRELVGASVIPLPRLRRIE